MTVAPHWNNVGIITALVAVGFSSGSPSNFWPPYEQEAGGATLSTLRFVLPAMTYLTGFSLVSLMAEDANIPPERIGKMVVATVLVAGAFYTLVLLASAWIIPWERTATLDQGTIQAYRIAGFPALGWGAYAIGVIGLVTSFLALFAATSRVILAMARAGLFPAAFARLSSHRGTPVNALIFTFVLAVALGWLGEAALTWFLDTGGVYIGLAWVSAVVSMYRIRRRYPGLSSSYRVGASWLPVVGGAAAVVVIVAALIPGTDVSLIWPYEHAILAGWVLLGILIYALAPKRTDLRTLLGEKNYARLHRGEASDSTVGDASTGGSRKSP